MIRAAAKNFNDVTVIASKNDYAELVSLLKCRMVSLSLDQRRAFAAKAFSIVADYDIAINNYFNKIHLPMKKDPLRYGENPHQQAVFYGNLNECFEQFNGKEISYNNLVDIDACS